MPIHLAVNIGLSLGVHQQGDDESVKTQDFGENEDENHADEETGLLSGASDASVTNNADGESGSQTRKADGQTSSELDEAGEESFFLGKVVRDQDRHDQAVNTNDTSHNDGDNVCGGVVRICFVLSDHIGRHLLLTIRSGRRTPMAEIPTPDFAVP